MGSGQNLTQDITLDSTASVRGTILVKGTNAPLAGNGISLLEPDGTVQNGVTDVNGDYSFSNLVPGDYTLMLPEGSHRQSFELSAVTPNVIINITLPVGAIQGRVVLGDGVTPDGNATVVLLQNGQALLSDPADYTAGTYQFDTVTPGTYDLAVVDGADSFPIQSVVVAAGQTTQVPDIAPGTASVQFSFDDSSHQPIAAEGVLYLNQLALPSGLAAPQVFDIPSSGQLSVTGLAPGAYVAQVFLPNGPPVQVPISVPAGTSTLVLDVPDLAQVTGQVTSDDTSPVAGIDVLAYNPASPQLVYRTTTDGQGNYLLNLPPGSYTLVAADNRDASETQFELATAPGIQASAGADATNNFVLTAASIAVSGQVTDAQGDLPSSGTLTVANADGVSVLTANLALGGTFTLATLAPGAYTLSFAASGYTVSPLPLSVVAGQTVTGLTFQADWLVDAAPPVGQNGAAQTVLENMPQGLVGALNSLENFFRQTLFNEPQLPKAITRADLVLPELLDNCPDALGWFRDALIYQQYANSLFQNYHQLWEVQVDINNANFGLFASDLAIFIGTLVTDEGTGFDAGKLQQVNQILDQGARNLTKQTNLSAQEFKAASDAFQQARVTATQLFHNNIGPDLVQTSVTTVASEVEFQTGLTPQGALPDMDNLASDFANYYNAGNAYRADPSGSNSLNSALALTALTNDATGVLGTLNALLAPCKTQRSPIPWEMGRSAIFWGPCNRSRMHCNSL